MHINQKYIRYILYINHTTLLIPGGKFRLEINTLSTVQSLIISTNNSSNTNYTTANEIVQLDLREVKINSSVCRGKMMATKTISPKRPVTLYSYYVQEKYVIKLLLVFHTSNWSIMVNAFFALEHANTNVT